MIQGLRVANRAIHRRTPAAIVASTANNGTGDDSSLIGGSASFSTSSSPGAPVLRGRQAPRAVRREDRRDQGIIHQAAAKKPVVKAKASAEPKASRRKTPSPP